MDFSLSFNTKNISSGSILIISTFLLGSGEYDSQGKQADKGFECLGTVKPYIQVMDDNCYKQNIQKILRSNVSYYRNNAQIFIPF